MSAFPICLESRKPLSLIRAPRCALTILGASHPRRWSLAPDLRRSPDVRSPGQRRAFSKPIHDQTSDKTRRDNKQQTRVTRMLGAPQQVTTPAGSLPLSSSASRPSRPAIVIRASISTPDAHQFHIAEPETAAECCHEQPAEPARGDSPKQISVITERSGFASGKPHGELRCAARAPNYTINRGTNTLSEKVSCIAWTATATVVLVQRADAVNYRALAASTRTLSSATACYPVTPAAPPRPRCKIIQRSESDPTSLVAFLKGDQARGVGLGNQASGSTSNDTESHEIPSSQTESSSLSRLSVATDSATAPSQMQSAEESKTLARDIITQLRQHRARWTASKKGAGNLEREEEEDSRTQVRDIVTRWTAGNLTGGGQQTEVIDPSPRRVCSLVTGPGDVVLALRSSKQPGIYLCPSPSKMLDSITYRAIC
jgi:hypothetical protein